MLSPFSSLLAVYQILISTPNHLRSADKQKGIKLCYFILQIAFSNRNKSMLELLICHAIHFSNKKICFFGSRKPKLRKHQQVLSIVLLSNEWVFLYISFSLQYNLYRYYSLDWVFALKVIHKILSFFLVRGRLTSSNRFCWN